MDLALVASGFAVGALVGMTGVGSGSLMTPMLVLAFGVAPVTAVGTDLLYAAITKAGGAYLHARRGGVDWRLAGRMAAGSVPAALLTLVALHLMVEDRATLARTVSVALGFALILTAAALLAHERLREWAARRTAGSAAADDRRVVARTVAVGALLGALVTVSSLGAGALGVSALLLLYPGLAATRIIGTDIAHAVPLTLVAGLGHASAGAVDWHLLVTLLAGSLPGIWLGTRLGGRVPERLLRSVLAGVLLLVAGRLVL